MFDLLIKNADIYNGNGGDPVKGNIWVEAGSCRYRQRRAHGARDRRCGRPCGDAWICGSAHPLRRAGHMGPKLFAFALAWRHYLRNGKLRLWYRAEPTQNPRYDHEKPLRRRGDGP